MRASAVINALSYSSVANILRSGLDQAPATSEAVKPAPPHGNTFVMPRLFEDLALARLDGRFPRLVDKLARVHLLVLDDWGTHTLNDRRRLDLLEFFEERYRRKSALITAQLPVAAWHEMIGEATLADAILDRIVQNAHRITLEGDSMRKRKMPTLLTGGEITEINHP